ncbi:unnamed protein product [Orchesella dallaii]|uniref:Membrane magnesium transporter n=1 Tax=Orchesella dallaii TaxID=48710 RepID=A0ABP1QKN5_9HEXA
MAQTIGKIGVLVGVMLLCHTGYSVSQHLQFLRYNEDEFTSLPLDMVLEALLGVALAIWGASATKTFKEIRAVEDIACKSYESFFNRPNFMTFNHRGKKLFGMTN